MSASDVRATQHRSVATALVAGWFFVIPHKGGFAPELGSSGTFVVVAVLYSFHTSAASSHSGFTYD
jgi:hypothetical protein